MRHDVLERLQEILLEVVIGKLGFLQELHGQLAQRINSVHGDIVILMNADLYNVAAEPMPAVHENRCTMIGHSYRIDCMQTFLK
jgi:hypothetical protein